VLAGTATVLAGTATATNLVDCCSLLLLTAPLLPPLLLTASGPSPSPTPRMPLQLPSLGGFLQLPLPLRLNRGAHAAVRRYHFVKQLKAASGGGGGGWSDVKLGQPEAGEGEPEDEDDERLRTILVANFDGTESDLRRVYSQFGEIESVNPGKGEPTQKGIGRVVFADTATVNAVMQLTAREAVSAAAAVADAEDDLDDDADAAAQAGSDGADEDDDGFQVVGSQDEGEEAEAEAARAPSGFRKWYQEHLTDRPGVESLQSYCDGALSGYDYRRQEAERAADAARNVPDEDGFITVSHRSRRNTHTDGSVHVKAASAGSAAAAERRLKAKGPNGAERTFSDFYRFQTRARREDELTSLRTRFAADKEKILRAKSLREGQQRYKPY
jgi:hypothetical protein